MNAPKTFSRGWTLFFLVLPVLVGGHWLATHVDRTVWARHWSDVVAWGQHVLPELTADAPLRYVMLPAAIMLVAGLILRLLFDTPPNWMRVPLWLGFTSAQVVYLVYRVVGTLALDTVPNAVASLLFFLAEAFIHVRIAIGNTTLLRLTDRSAQADASARLVRSGRYLPTVDVFVPTYSEPVEMLRRSIIGCQAMEYPRKTVYLLDDQRRPAMRALAEELGCEYVCRPDNQHAKAGNLNHALGRTQGELVLCFDADFIPTRDFLQRTVGFFQDPAVAMVQTPQNFFNDDAVTRNLGLEGVLDDEQRLFFRALQPGRDAVNAVVCHGSCFVARRSALEAVGGVPTETITEDWATSIKLQAAGYKIQYLNEALSAGVAADKCGEFVQQRARWAQGTLQALFASTNPLTVAGLNWKQRFFHFSAILYYLGSLSTMINLVAPLFFLFFGLVIVRMTVPEILFYRLPFLLFFYLLFSWMNGRTRSAIWTELYDAFLAPAMAVTAVRSLWKPFATGFRVTDKSMRQQGLRINRRVAAPFVILILLHLLGLFYAIETGRQLEDRTTFAIVLYFTLSNLVLLWPCLLVTIDVAQESVQRFAHQATCLLMWNDTGLQGQTLWMSEKDVTFKVTSAVPAGGLPARGMISIPAAGLAYVPVDIEPEPEAGGWRCTFARMALAQERSLIQFLYCQPGQWDRRHRPLNEARTMWEYFLAGIRMYSLAESK